MTVGNGRVRGNGRTYRGGGESVPSRPVQPDRCDHARTVRRVTRRPLIVFFLLAAVLVPAVVAHPGRDADALSGRYVLITPTIGAYRKPFRAFLTTRELDVMTRMGSRLRAARKVPRRVVNTGVFHVEPGSGDSPLFLAQRTVLRELQRVLEKYNGTIADWRVDIVVGRSQAYLKSTLASLGCNANFSPTDGVVQMGAALCGRHYLADNLTGYLFLRSSDDILTGAMERAREPRVGSIPYLIAMRNLSGLAHEWAHIYRAAGQNGRVFTDEPAWVREGLAEIWSGIAIVNSNIARMTYTDWHVIRLRRFLDWSRRCNVKLIDFRTGSPATNGCEYFIGPLAIELLIARHGGLENLIKVFHLNDPEQGFLDDFEEVYGMTLGDFEKEADAYIAGIREAELTR